MNVFIFNVFIKNVEQDFLWLKLDSTDSTIDTGVTISLTEGIQSVNFLFSVYSVFCPPGYTWNREYFHAPFTSYTSLPVSDFLPLILSVLHTSISTQTKLTPVVLSLFPKISAF